MKIDYIQEIIKEHNILYFNDPLFHLICNHFNSSAEISDNIIITYIIKLCESRMVISNKLEAYVLRFGNIFDVNGEKIKEVNNGKISN